MVLYNNSRFEMLLAKKVKPRKTNKSKTKRQRTFTSSEFSLPEDRQLSLSELFRNDLLKRKAMPKPNKSQKQLGATKKRTKSKSKLRLDKCETYEVIPYKNSLNSQIIFSNEDTKREGMIEDSMSEQLAIRVNQQYLVDSNRQLRISIKKEYQKKVDAAIKIQKVFRGYLTRKILLKYVQQEQKILSERLAQHRSESVSEHSSYFADKSVNESKRRVLSEQQGVFQFSNQHDNQEEEDSSEEEIEIRAYRHHEAIYSKEDISGYLSESEEEDFDEDAFNNHIIFETNEEYIDSRKSSGQNQQPKNKLSRAGHPEPISQEPPQTPTNPNPPRPEDDLNLTKTQKKADRDRMRANQQGEIRQYTVKLKQQNEKSNNSLEFQQNELNEATLKESEIVMRKGSKKYVQLQLANMERLKQTEKTKWDEIINLVQSQMEYKVLDNSQITDFMKKIMQMSIKNKEMLELQLPIQSNSSKSSLHENALVKIDSKNKLKSIKANRHYLNHHDSVDGEEKEEENQKHCQSIQPEKKKEGIALPESIVLFEREHEKKQNQSDVPVSFNSPVSSFENTGQMKKFLSGNIQEQHIDEILKLREDLIRKRQFDQLKQLNIDLQKKSISQEEFMSRIEGITQKYSNEKIGIEKTKQDISKGYEAALRLTKQAMKDAKKMGFNLPVSRSMEGIRFKSPLIIPDLVIDELPLMKKIEKSPKAHLLKELQKSKEIRLSPQSDSENSDLEFTEEELKRFRRAQPYDIELAEEIADMGRNVMIGEELFRQQQMEEDQNNLMKTQHVYREIYEIQEASPPPKNDPEVDMISEKVLEWIFLDLTGELLIKPLFSERLIDKSHFYKPKPVSDKERLRFIELLQKNFPSMQELNSKLNQKICPLPTELLRCMRIDFSEQDQDDDNSYEQIGKYQFIIGQQICNEAIKQFLKQIQRQNPSIQPSLSQLQELKNEYNLNDKVVKYIEQREKYISNRRNHTKELRWEVLNIQVHCIFDAWNQELIFLRSQKAGYSGIGLNQLTLSIKDHNCLVPKEETLELVKKGKNKLIRNLSLSSPMIIFPMAIEEEEDEQLEQDSRWIFYADEALSYGLELVYLIEEEVFNELAKELRKRMLHFFQK